MISLIQGDLFEACTDAIIMTIDGMRRSLEGNIARQFAKKWPDVWAEVDDELSYPIPFGNVFDYTPVAECPFKLLLIAATLPHSGNLKDSYLKGVVRSAVVESIMRSADYGIDRIALALMVGGWRLTHDKAFIAMAEGYESVQHAMRKQIEMNIYIPDQQQYLHIRAVADSMGWK